MFMKYIMKDNMMATLSSIDGGKLIQVFQHPICAETNDYVVAKLMEDGVLNYNDVKVAELMYDAVICTEAQLARFMESVGITDTKNRMEILFNNFVLDRFIFASEKDESFNAGFPGDAAVFYCLHSAGYKLLMRYSEKYYTWNPLNVTCCPKNLYKYIMTVEVDREFKRIFEGYDKFPLPFFRIASRKSNLMAEAVYAYKKNGRNRYILLDYFFKITSELHAIDVLNNYDMLLTTKLWRNFYPAEKPPVLCLVADSMETIGRMSNILVKTSPRLAEYVIFTLPEKIAEGLDKDDAFFNIEKDDSGDNALYTYKLDC